MGGRKILSENFKKDLTILKNYGKINYVVADMLELADETDSKSVGGDTVWVRPPSPAFLIPKPFSGLGIFCVADKRNKFVMQERDVC